MSHVDDLATMLWNKLLWWLQYRHIQDLAHVTGTLPANTVSTPAIVPGSVTPDRLSFDPATQAELDAHKTASPIDHPAGSVTPAKLAAGGTIPDATKYYRGDGTWQVVSSAGSSETFGVVFNNAGDVALKNDGTLATKRY